MQLLQHFMHGIAQLVMLVAWHMLAYSLHGMCTVRWFKALLYIEVIVLALAKVQARAHGHHPIASYKMNDTAVFFCAA